MSQKRISLDLDIATSKAQSNLKDAAKEAKKLGTSLDDTRSAGKKLADAMDTVTGEVEKEFAQAVKAADKLEKAIGEDGVQAFKDNGKSVDDLVADLKKAGLTYDDITEDSDALAASLKRMNAVGDQINTHVTKNMEGVRDSSDRAKGAMANFAGNAAQELPVVSTAFGPLNTGVSQLVEGLAEGDIGFGKLAVAAGGMALVGVIMKGIADDAKKAAAVKAFRKEGVDAYVASLRKGDTAIKAITDRMEEAGKIEVKLNGVLGEMFSGDKLQSFARAGISIEQFATAVSKGEEGIQALDAALTAANVPAKEHADVLLAAYQEVENMAQAEKTAAAMTKVFGSETDVAARKIRTLEEALQGFNHQWDILNGKLDAEDTYNAAIEALHDTTMATNDKKRAIHELLQEVYKMPASTATKIDVALDKGDMEEAERQLAILTRARYAGILTKVTGNDIHGNKVDFKAAATGTTAAMKGDAIKVGETGTELFIPNTDGQILNSTRTANLLNSPNPTSYVDNSKHFYYLPSQTPETLAQESRRYNRRNGTGDY